ncbi:FusB/FusC family EF-G-binding protein [Bacillus tianshenii]|nr:FusB/FusC family EF-G-binding protein [Bacillus tianshenii]
MEPFIRNHHFNFIKQQVYQVLYQINSVKDPEIIEAVKLSAREKVFNMFPDMTIEQQALLRPIAKMRKEEEFSNYLDMLSIYRTKFPKLNTKKLQSLFPKVKKLKMPKLELDYKSLTYIGWKDYSSNTIYLVYEMDSELIGIEGKYTPIRQKNMCSLCNQYERVALVTAVNKETSSVDAYKAYGNYMCIDSDQCNRNIIDVTNLENFVARIIG